MLAPDVIGRTVDYQLLVLIHLNLSSLKRVMSVSFEEISTLGSLYGSFHSPAFLTAIVHWIRVARIPHYLIYFNLKLFKCANWLSERGNYETRWPVHLSALMTLNQFL